MILEFEFYPENPELTFAFQYFLQFLLGFFHQEDNFIGKQMLLFLFNSMFLCLYVYACIYFIQVLVNNLNNGMLQSRLGSK